jgi:alkanesulfonate monooxygenase SsuD/methylene tetrahydromethanopterin reductase-like flavin-dependent oxidoreductase (luciferase family)
MSRKVLFYQMHMSSYPAIPPAEEFASTWITLPNSHYDPELGHKLYNRYLGEAVLSEQLGFDGVCVNEHHQNAYGVSPDPNVLASHIAAQTEHVAISILGNALPLHDNPLRIAESVAMLDVISGGRMISGFVRGQGMEYHSTGVNPAHSHGRFWEAHDLIIKAWTEPGPFEWHGRYFDIPYVNPWPRPYQQPHPPVWLPGVGSPETIAAAARHKYPYMMVYAPRELTRKSYDLYRQKADEAGYEPTRQQLAFVAPVYVAETDEKAHQEIREHVEWHFGTGMKIPDAMYFPPGYLSSRSRAHMMRAAQEYGMKPFHQMSYEDIIEADYVLVGSPETVAEKLSFYIDDLGAGVHVQFALGSTPHWKHVKSSTLFAEQVIPQFRDADNKPAWANKEPLPGRLTWEDLEERKLREAEAAVA